MDVFINTRQLNQENIDKIYNKIGSNNFEEKDDIINSLYYKNFIDNYASIELKKDYFEKNCIKNDINNQITEKTCNLYIYIIQSQNSKKYHKDSQYVITAKSSLNTGNILLSGQVYNIKSKENKTDHFIIEEVKHRKGITINIFFKSGQGKVYARIPKNPEIGQNLTFPNENLFDYMGVDTYMGKLITIPPKVFDRINSQSLKLQILISVIPYISDSNKVEYTISYGSEPKRISQNVPYQSFLSAGEMHYFTFYFDESTENIYISLSNMNGDADMYMNYGNDKLPTVNDYHWSSNTIGHEYIDINIKDPFFKRKQIKSLNGYYTLLILGYTD